MHLRCFVAVIFLVFGAGNLLAQERWSASRLDGSSVPETIVKETRQMVPHGLPDGLIEAYGGKGDITASWYADPTTRYGHGILGDAIEASRLIVRMRGGRQLAFSLPETEVFEDRYPRLADLDRDGTTEIVTIRSSVSLGASVTVYGVAGNRLVQRATTGFIGLANRWLNIAGIADFRGTGKMQIAFVRTPHIGGTLLIYDLDESGLKQVGVLDGFSNHVIGSREMRLSALADINGDGRMDLALPSADRRRLRIVGFAGGTLTEFASARVPARIDKAIAVKGSGQAARFVVGLENAEIHEIHR
jgi:hypothetical protein